MDFIILQISRGIINVEPYNLDIIRTAMVRFVAVKFMAVQAIFLQMEAINQNVPFLQFLETGKVEF